MPVPKDVQYILENLPVGMIQSGIPFSKVDRIDVPYSQSPKGYILKERSYKIKGSGIPASTLSKFASGEWTPREKTITKLRNLYGRINYHRVRQAGLNTEEARRYTRQSVDNVDKKVEKLEYYVKQIAKEKNVDPDFIRHGISQSIHSSEYWDEYLKTLKSK